MISRMLLSTMLCASLLSAPAYADRYDRDWHDEHGRHYGWDRRDAWHHPHATVIYRTAPQVDYVYVPTTPLPARGYRQINCTNDYNPLGILLGGVAGGVLGHQIGHGKGRTVATVGGAVIGAGIGGNIASERCTETVFRQAPIGVPINWQDLNAQEYYQVVPTREYSSNGQYCREYQAHATIGGRTQDTYGTACMQPDGSWQVIN